MRVFVQTTKWHKFRKMSAVYEEISKYIPTIDHGKFHGKETQAERIAASLNTEEFIYIMHHVNSMIRVYMIGALFSSKSRKSIAALQGIELFTIVDDMNLPGYTFEYLASVLTYDGITHAIKAGANPGFFNRKLDASCSFGKLPYRLQRNVIQFLCVCRHLPTRLNRDVCMRIVRSYLHTETIYMQAVYTSMRMPMDHLRLQWGGGKRISKPRMAAELADVQSTHALFYGCSNFGDTALNQPARTPSERLRNAWVLGNYAECAKELGVPITNELITLFRMLCREPAKWKILYDACGPENMPLQLILSPMEHATRDMIYEAQPYVSRKKLVRALLFISQVTYKRNEWHLFAESHMFFYNMGNYREVADFAMERGAGWRVVIESTARNNRWLEWWNLWKPSVSTFAFTLEFRAQASVVMLMFPNNPLLGQTVVKHMARAMYLNNVQRKNPDPTSRWTRDKCIEYMKRFGVRANKSKGVLGLQKDAHELYCAVTLYLTE